ncbi:MAG: NusG domain II-containing protein [Eubacteriales bacterium]|nr:NusG domain II-containing protein [Eubacteriales bacterium]
MKNKLGLRPGDFLLFALILLGACAIWIRFAMLQTDQVYGEIWQDGECVQRIELADSYRNTFTLDGDSTEYTIEVDGKRMRFVDSQCPDHTCERTGWISRVGDTAVCLPNRVLIKIVRADGSSDGEVDATVR